MVLAGAVAGTVTAAATDVGAAGTLNGNYVSYLFWKHVTYYHTQPVGTLFLYKSLWMRPKMTVF